MSKKTILSALAAALVAAAPLGAQQQPEQPKFNSFAQFEQPKLNPFAWNGLKVHFHASFAQTFQDLHDYNTAVPNVQNGVDQTLLGNIGAGFDLAMANAHVVADVAPGTRVVVNAYLASRHHNDTWIKDGYLLVDASPINNDILQMLMSVVTLKVGHFEPNFGDAHFRRSDNADVMANPFIENLILDAHTMEIGGEADLRLGSLLGVVGVTTGENKGDVTNPQNRGYSVLGKVGFDHRFNDDLRVRLTGSTYQNGKDAGSTLFTGDRAGSAFWGVMDTKAGTEFRNGRMNPNFTRVVRAYELDPFVQYRDLDLYGVIEQAHGRTASETQNRTVTQYDIDGVYHLAGGRAYVAGRYNRVRGEFLTLGSNQTVKRAAIAAGWYMNPHVLLKGEYVKQTYEGFPVDNILNGGKFDGLVIQGAVSF